MLALQEWRHWLEGVQHPFTVWTDHKNLSYLCTARGLNPRQSHWALILGRFNFTLFYRPRSRNIKLDALSHQFSPLTMRTSDRRPFYPVLVWLELPVGRWRTSSNKPSRVDKLQRTAPLAGCLSLSLLNPLFFSGGMLLRLHAIWVFIAPWNYSNSASGVRVSPLTPMNLLLPALSAPATRLLIAPRRACYILFQLPTDPGPILPWTSRVYRLLRETPPSSPLWTGSPKWSAKYLYPSCLLTGPACLLTSWHSPRYCFGSGSPVHFASLEQFLPGAGSHCKPFFWLSSSLMIRWSGPIRTWRLLSAVSPVVICPPGLPTSLGSNMPIILWFPLPWVCCLSWSLWVTNLHFFRVRSLMWLLQNCLHQAHRVWREARPALSQTAARNQKLANRPRSAAPEYKVGQKVWLSTRDILLQVDSRKLASGFIGPFVVEQVINPSVVRLRLPSSLNIHPTFNISLLKPVSPSSLSPSTEPLPPVASSITTQPTRSSSCWTTGGMVMDSSIWLIERVTVGRITPSSDCWGGGGTVMV